MSIVGEEQRRLKKIVMLKTIHFYIFCNSVLHMHKEVLFISLVLVASLLLLGCSAPEPATQEQPVQKTAEAMRDGFPAEETAPLEETAPAAENTAIAGREPEAWETSREPEKTEEAMELFPPQLTYPDAYNGPLYATSEQIGDSAPLSHLQNLRRNGVNFIIAFFGIEIDPGEEEDLAVLYAKTFVQSAPGRVVPFFSPGMGGSETKPLVGDKLTSIYRDTLEVIKEQAGEDFIRGIGEIEQYAWDIQPNDPKMLQLFDLAAENNLAVMFHPDPGQTNGVKAVIERYPETTFLIHMFPEDFDRDRQDYINLMKMHDNLYFSVDVDHMMFEGQTGLLYKYEDEPVETAKRHFIANYDRNEQQLLNAALNRYKPLIEAVPDKAMWGTEGGTEYVYEPEVYDRMIKFTRLFIGQLDPSVQGKFAYQNAERLINEVDG